MKKAFTADAMSKLRYLSRPEIAPDGQMLAYVESYADAEGIHFISQIHLYDKRSGTERSWAKGERESRKQPHFLPNGRLLYLSDDSGVWQLHVLELDSMHSRPLTSARHGVVRYSACDEGAHIAFEATLWPEDVEKGQCFRELNAKEKAAWEKELDMRPYCITELTYKQDAWFGMRKGECSHLCVIDADGQQRLIDTNGIEAAWPTVSHDGSTVAFYGYPHTGARGRQAELMCCAFDGTGLRTLTEDLGIYDDHFPQFFHDDLSVICGAYPAYEDGSTIMMPYRVQLSDGSHDCLFQEGDESLCHGLHCVGANRTEYGEEAQYFYLTEDDEYLYFQSSFAGTSNLYRVYLQNKGAIERVIAGKSDIQAFSMTGDGTQMVYLMADETHPAEFYCNGQQLTDVNGWLREYELGRVEECWCTGRNGATRLQYYLVYPTDYTPGQRVPTILYVKGGPETVYLKSFWHQFQALANRGFAVICGNHRGSTGFGRAFCANGICWQNGAMEDLLDMVDDVIERGIADPDRLGVTGGSYGGYMTNKLIGRTDLFSAAVTQRSLVDPATSYGTGDMGFISSQPVPADFRMIDYLADRARGSIITYIDNIKVPLLILHSFQDYRCSFEQAEQLFIPMRERNPEVPVRLVAFPNENHGLTRSGQLRHQQRHLQELLDWFDKYLINEGGAAK